ncbi:Na+/H+ antiporter subunit C [Chrysiogenes arsenatis]|uniref:Na+/H+ antiporter subunit C n=1 Tax=Chrysiogenes arsenatis TaxID=309797 RepID=UPI000487D5CC|nr:Na+/H+ antiporter subunit C [Chrysiogenes arsenatis]
MELLVSLCIGLLVACGVYLMLRARTYPVIVGLSLLGYAVNLFLFLTGRLATNLPAVIQKGQVAEYTDPLPQALVLTAIVIGFGMVAYVVTLAIKAQAETGNDHVDGKENTL